MQHQLGSSEGSISLEKDGEELHCKTREPAAFSPAIGAGKRQEEGEPRQWPAPGDVSCLHAAGMYTSVLCQTFNHFWNLSRCCTAAGGIAFAVLLFREAGEEGERKEEGNRYIQMLRWLLFTPLLFSISPLFPSLPLLSTLALYKGMFNT